MCVHTHAQTCIGVCVCVGVEPVTLLLFDSTGHVSLACCASCWGGCGEPGWGSYPSLGLVVQDDLSALSMEGLETGCSGVTQKGPGQASCRKVVWRSRVSHAG